MWVVANYQFTSLFSLKPATATASGGRTLLVPTPYAIKMALLDVACRLVGQAEAESIWNAWLGTASIALRPVADVVVNNTFIRILRPPKKPEPGQPFQRTIAYREYAQLAGHLGIAIQIEDEKQSETIIRWLAHINYLGKRGSFVQLQNLPMIVDQLAGDWLIIGEAISNGFALDAILTQLDDTTSDATFDVVSVYSGKHLKMGKHRVLHHVALPYQRVRSSRAYTHYQLRQEE